MDALGFVRKLKEKTNTNPSKLSAEKYFETSEGRKMIHIISEKVEIIDEKSFTLTDWCIIAGFENNPLYQGRSFFKDMEALGFSCEIISYHQDEAPIKTYLFKVK